LSKRGEPIYRTTRRPGHGTYRIRRRNGGGTWSNIHAPIDDAFVEAFRRAFEEDDTDQTMSFLAGWDQEAGQVVEIIGTWRDQFRLREAEDEVLGYEGLPVDPFTALDEPPDPAEAS
jgi:PAS domain-containing protein